MKVLKPDHMETAEPAFTLGSFLKTAVIILAFFYLFPSVSHALTARDRYYVAENAYQKFRKNAKHVKYRDKWLAHIDKFQHVYRYDPTGPWAAASLYRSAELYLVLYKRSYRLSDKKEAKDLFQRIVNKFPKSRYNKKARVRLAKLASVKNKKSRAFVKGRKTGAPVKKNDPIASVIAKNKAAQNKINKTSVHSKGYSTVQALRFWSNPSYTRIVIDADQETSFAHRLLKKDPSIKKPKRLFIDLKRSRLGPDIKKFVPINDELLSDVRAGQYTTEAVRVVVDIKSFKHYKIFSLKNPFRIVLDVWGVDSDKKKKKHTAPSIAKGDTKPAPGAIAKQLALGVSTIVIDPGHGGRDHGAPGYYKGTREKDIALAIAKQLAVRIKKQLKCRVVLTRTTDKYLTLEERTAIANTKNADLFISIHTNAARDKRAYGIETFFLNLATDDEAIMVAARENATSAKNISDLESILNDLMQNAKINESSRLASRVQSSVLGHMRKKYSHIKSKGVKQAPFYVLLGAQMPAILVETSFISNPRECKRLGNQHYQKHLCDGIIKGIQKYIKETNPTAFLSYPSEKGGKG